LGQKQKEKKKGDVQPRKKKKKTKQVKKGLNYFGPIKKNFKKSRAMYLGLEKKKIHPLLDQIFDSIFG